MRARSNWKKPIGSRLCFNMAWTKQSSRWPWTTLLGTSRFML